MPSRGRRLAVVWILMVANFLVDVLAHESAFRSPLRWLSSAAIMIHMALSARSGYLKHRGHWTRESWRRYLTACAIPVLSLVLLFGLMFAMDARWPVFGQSGTPLRWLWAFSLVLLMLTGAIGLSIVVDRLDRGDPNRQFEWPRWMRRAT